MPTEKETTIVMLEVSGWGGLCHYTFNLCRELAAADVDVRLLSISENELRDQPRQFQMIPLFDRSDGYPRKWRLILKYLREHRPHILHVQSLFTARKDFALLLILRMLRVKVVYTAHNVFPHDEHERRALGMKFVFKCIYRFVDRIITHSPRDRDEIAATFDIHPEKIETIRHGNYDFFPKASKQGTKALRARYRISEDRTVILCFGALRRYKGVHKLISSFASFGGQEKGMTLLIVGSKSDDRYFEELSGLISEHELGDSVILVGDYIAFDKVADYFGIADIVALPYEHIYDSGVLRLAFSFHKPVMATRVGIFQDFVIDGKNGFLISDEPHGITGALERLHTTSKETLIGMGDYSSMRFGAELEWKTVAAKTYALYRGIIDSGKSNDPDEGPA